MYVTLTQFFETRKKQPCKQKTVWLKNHVSGGLPPVFIASIGLWSYLISYKELFLLKNQCLPIS